MHKINSESTNSFTKIIDRNSGYKAFVEVDCHDYHKGHVSK